MTENAEPTLFPDLPRRRPSPQEVLSLPLPQPNDAQAATVRDYLITLLHELWREEAGFSGKRPFGNSGWQYDLYVPMGRAGWAGITLDGDGYVDDFPAEAVRQADNLIHAAIHALGEPADSVTVRQDDLRAVLAAAYDLCPDREAFARLAEAAGLAS